MDSFRSAAINGLRSLKGFASLTIDTTLASAHWLVIEGSRAFDFEKPKIEVNDRAEEAEVRCLLLTAGFIHMIIHILLAAKQRSYDMKSKPKKSVLEQQVQELFGINQLQCKSIRIASFAVMDLVISSV